MRGQIPVVLRAVPIPISMLVTCTICGAQTTKPNKIMRLRGQLITDGCGECPPPEAPSINLRYC